MNVLLRLYLFVALCLYGIVALCQSGPVINTLINTIDANRKQLPVEKLHLQLDKQNYIQGDTIWFKGYLLNADYLIPSLRSGLLYVELNDSENKNVYRALLPVASGLTWGNIALPEKDIPEGSYTLRAYANWMRNFGEDYIFKQNIYIASAGSNSRLVTAAFKQKGNNIQANILLTDQDKQPVRLKDMELRVMNGKHNLFKSNVSTGMDGRMDVNFDLPDKISTTDLSIIAKDVSKTTDPGGSLTIPVMLNRQTNVDLQFMPEGGKLVAGISTKVGFKAIAEDGKGTEVSGTIYNSKQQQIASFKSVHKGMGAFEFTPESGETYTAKLEGITKSYALPLVNVSGTTIHITQSRDSITVKVSAAGVASADYYLIGEARGVVCYAAHFVITPGAIQARQIAIGLFPTGVAHFTLLNTNNHPLNERLVYIDHHDNLQLNVTTDQKTYAPHDSIALHLAVTDKTGRPVQGSFSLAVTDDSQVRIDSTGSNIVNNMLLTSDLKGTVEEPGYYLDNDTPEKSIALDNLLLTQGWVGYDWKQLFAPQKQPAYIAEKEYTIQGKVTNMFGKPIAASGITLFSEKPAMVTDAVTDKDGVFTFRGIEPVDTAAFVIQARRRKGSSFNIGIDVDEFKPPIFTPVKKTAPWYVNSDTLLLNNKSSRLSQQTAEQNLQGYGHLLKTVTIKDKRIIKDSHNLNGPGEADFILDEKEMVAAKKLTLYELLQKKFSGVYKGGTAMYPRYLFNGHTIHLVIDGVFTERQELPVDLYMNYLTAEDIKGIEIMYKIGRVTAYDPEYSYKVITYGSLGHPPVDFLPVFFEVTTYSGNGAFMKKTPGVYIYRPLPFSMPKQFYRPRYAVKNRINGTDQRSTIHWEPNIVTDKDGKAVVSFYSADKPAGYSIIMQGTDMNGQLGFTKQRILIH